MHRKYSRIGRETLEIVEKYPLERLNDLLLFKESEETSALAFTWPGEPDDDTQRQALLSILDSFRVDELAPIEERCGRINRMVDGKGPTSLKHIILQKLDADDIAEFDIQPDDLCKSAWAYTRFHAEFADAEAFLGVRQYRDFGKLYDAFEVESQIGKKADSSIIDLDALASRLTARLDLPESVVIRTLDLPATESHPFSVFVIIRHAGPLSSVYNHKSNGMRSAIYYRAPNEATLIWKPSDQTIEICGPSPQVRRVVAESFTEVVIGTDLSKKPLTLRYYDLSRFYNSLDLNKPDWPDIHVEEAKVVGIDLRLGNWKRRLTLKVTIDDDIEQVAKQFLGGIRFLRKVEGFSLVTVAIKYKCRGDKGARTMQISFGDRSSNILSKSDKSQRDIGQKLLQFWGILNRLQPLQYDDIKQVLPNLLKLYDFPDSIVTGGHLRSIGLDAKRLLDGGILTFKAKARFVISGDTDEDLVIEQFSENGQTPIQDGIGEQVGKQPDEDFREYEIKTDWLEEILIDGFKTLIGKTRVQQISENLSYLGQIAHVDGSKLPLYLARRLDQAETIQQIDTTLRSRQEGGFGIVLAANDTPLTHLGPNVVVPLSNVLGVDGITPEVTEQILYQFKTGRWLAQGGSEVALMKFGNHMAMLYIPGKLPLPIGGAQQVLVIDRLVAAHKAGKPGEVTGVVMEGTNYRTPSDAWPNGSRAKVLGHYFEHPSRNLWRLKVD